MTGKYANPICKIPSLLAAQCGSVYIVYIIVWRIIMIQTAHCSKSNILNFANRNLLIGGDHVAGIGYIYIYNIVQPCLYIIMRAIVRRCIYMV